MPIGKSACVSASKEKGCFVAEVLNPLVVKLVDRGFCEGQEILNTTHWIIRGGGVWTPVIMDQLGDAYADWWGTNMQGLTVAGYVKSEIVITQLAVNGFQRIITDGLPLSGSLVGDGLPLNVAACVTLSTGRSGRAGRGRFYAGCLGEGATTGSRFSAGFVNSINSAFDALVNLEAVSGDPQFALVVYSTELNSLPRPTGLATEVTSAYLRDNVVDSQRRRLPGRGR